MPHAKRIEPREVRGASRREVLKTAAAGLGALTGVPKAAEALELEFDLESFFQKHFRKLSDDDLRRLIRRLERKHSKKYGKPIKVEATSPVDGRGVRLRLGHLPLHRLSALRVRMHR
jgi:hypothetical protein